MCYVLFTVCTISLALGNYLTTKYQENVDHFLHKKIIPGSSPCVGCACQEGFPAPKRWDMMILSRQRWSALLRKWYAGFHDVNTQTKTNQSEAKLNSSFSHDKTGVDKAKSSTSPNSRAAVDWKKLFISSKDINYKTHHCNYCHLYQRTCTLTASCADSSMFDYYDHQQHWLPL